MTVRPGLPTPRPQLAVTAAGFVAESYPSYARAAAQAMTSQGVRGMIVGLRAGDRITNLHCNLEVAGTGLTYARMGLYSNVTQVAISVDAIAAFQGTAGLLTVALTSVYQVPTDGGYYIVMMTDGGTPPTVSRGANTAGLGAAAGSGLIKIVAQGTQASLPSPANWGSAGTQSMWVACS